MNGAEAQAVESKHDNAEQMGELQDHCAPGEPTRCQHLGLPGTCAGGEEW